jgi:hypothetical protein
MNSDYAKGDEIIRLLSDRLELEWRKCSSRTAVSLTGIEKDDSKAPPFASFRFKREDARVVNALRECVSAFRGTVPWIMFPHDRAPLRGTNWVICPKICQDLEDEALRVGLSPFDYVATKRPDVGPLAYTDVKPLAESIRATLDAQREIRKADDHDGSQ